MGESVDLAKLTEELPEVADLLETENDAPIIRLINALLTQALREGASDIHLETFETRSVVRFRVDGALRDVVEPRRGLHAAIVSRIKVMASLDIAEKRLPQDGRIALRIAGRPIDVRVSTIPTGTASAWCCACSTSRPGASTLDALGMARGTRATQVDALIQQPHGIVLVTGPTGSGKTTTLYAALSRLDRKTRNIMTVEDPIEYDLDGISQTQVNPRIEMTLRAGAARDPAPGPRRGDDRRDPRPRDRADRGAGVAHRAPGARHAAHQRRAGRGHAADRHGRRAVPARLQPDRRARAAPGAQALRRVPRALEPDAAERSIFGAQRARAPLPRGWAAARATSPATRAAPASTSCSRSTTTCASWSTTPPPSASCAPTACARACCACARTACAGCARA